jgi:hypothetical protein
MGGVALDEDQLKSLANDPKALAKLGIGIDSKFAKSSTSVALDAGIVTPVTAGAMGTPVQFLQEFLQGVLHILTTARRGDVLAPLVTAGSWHDEEIVQTILEHLGTPELYKDHGDIPVTSWNQTFDRRTVVRFELGLQVQKLEEARAGKTQVNSSQEKRAAVALAFEILRNDVFFNGYNNGVNRTYGFLNDPNLPAFIVVALGGGGDTEWDTKTVAERVTDIVTAASALRQQSGSQVDPESMELKLAVASDVKDLMNESDASFSNGMTVNEWLAKNYPNIVTESIPEFNEANGGDSVFYLYAINATGSGTDDGNTVIQICPSKMQALNSVPTVKGFEEGYTNATAGCYVKRGYAVVRYSGI